ncbi:MAG: DUF2267 domain-containing protein [Polyangiaceae bacterium]|nr:DUF2267 domain-containing protein [Polyangiaceae bacterium]
MVMRSQPRAVTGGRADRTFYREVQRTAALGTLTEARSAAAAVVGALGDFLARDEAEAVARVVPSDLSALLHSHARGTPPPATLDTVARDVEDREEIPFGFAIEHTLAVCEAIGARLAPDARQRLVSDLPADLGRAFRRRELGRPTRRSHERTQSEPRRTLAEGNPASLHPLSEAAPKGAQSGSVAEPNPHADTKLSSARGLTQERFGDTLAEGDPPAPKRTVSRAH